MPKKWKQGVQAALDAELKGKSKEEKADILVEAHDEVNAVGATSGVELEDLKRARSRQDRASWG